MPVVGNFAGPKALRAVGRYIRERGATVAAFYVSNVEQYLFQDNLFDDFARNVATLPVDDDEHVHPIGLQPVRLLRAVSMDRRPRQRARSASGRSSAISSPGKSDSYYDVNVRSR